MPAVDINRMPGIGTEIPALYRRLFWSPDYARYIPAGLVINGALSRDPLNTGYIQDLEAGMLMGKITATGLYAPSVIGVVSADYTSGGTSLSASAATVTELVRRIGSSGTGYVIGPPTKTGTVAKTALTYSAASSTTITCTSLGVDKVAGSLICSDDGSETPLCLISEGTGVRVTDQNGTSISAVQFRNALIGGMILSGQILNYPSSSVSTTLQAWIKAQLQATGVWIFSDDFVSGV